ncbi:hypothetical protein GQ54DRAFT_308005 [Martensiomyces pterosporus]|nr:hypothetical protein GQ54DRAFT_308005 [Martensiomyces pterosporus]
MADPNTSLLSLPAEILRKISFYLDDDSVYDVKHPRRQLLAFAATCRALRHTCYPAIWRQATIPGKGSLASLLADRGEPQRVQVPDFIVPYGKYIRSLKIFYQEIEEGSLRADIAKPVFEHCPHLNTLAVFVPEAIPENASGDSSSGTEKPLLMTQFFNAMARDYTHVIKRLRSVTIGQCGDYTPGSGNYSSLYDVVGSMPRLRSLSLADFYIPRANLTRILAEKPIRSFCLSDEAGCGEHDGDILDAIPDAHLLRDLSIACCQWVKSRTLQQLFSRITAAGASHLTSLSFDYCMDFPADELLENLSPAQFPYLRSLRIGEWIDMDSDRALSYFRTHTWPRLCTLDLNGSTISAELLPAIGSMCPNLRSLDIACTYREGAEDRGPHVESIGKHFNAMLGKLGQLQHLKVASLAPSFTRAVFGAGMADVLRHSLVSIRIAQDLEDQSSDVEGIADGLARMQALRSIAVEIADPDDSPTWHAALSGPAFANMSILLDE